jgi:ABC-2 type transport system ATP-binding protein
VTTANRASTAIEVVGLHKHYGSLRAVDGISFQVATGEIYALLGQNGAGKTTTVEILEGHRERTAGEVSVLGVDPAVGGRGLRDRVGIVLQSTGLEPELSVREALWLYSRVYRRRADVDDLIELVGLRDKADQRVGSLSGGQRRRADLALGLVGQPELLFLDEPTTGFDPAARHQSWELISNLRAAGTTVVLTTHYLEEAEHLADRAGVIAAGTMVAEGTPAELTATLGGTTITVTLPEGTHPADLAQVIGPASRIAGQVVEMVTASPTGVLHALTSWAVGRGVELASIEVTRPTLEDVFLGLASGDRSGAEGDRDV